MIMSVFTVDAIGQTGVQLFVDAGRPIDEALINALIREVLCEKLSAMVGSRATGENRTQGDGFPLPVTVPPTADSEIIQKIQAEEVWRIFSLFSLFDYQFLSAPDLISMAHPVELCFVCIHFCRCFVSNVYSAFPFCRQDNIRCNMSFLCFVYF